MMMMHGALGFRCDKPTFYRHWPKMKICAGREAASLICRASHGRLPTWGTSATHGMLMTMIRQSDTLPAFHPEFGRFMLEATPGRPWGIGFKDLLDVEPNMAWRYVVQVYRQVPPLNNVADDSLRRITWPPTNTPSP